MRKILLTIFALLNICVFSQTVSPQVINSAGKSYPNPVSGMYFTDNIGEPFIQTFGPNANVMITEGFLQPFYISPTFKGNVFKDNLSCSDKNDGKLKIELETNVTTYTVKYAWSPTSVCPDSTCAEIDSLKAGNYKMKVLIRYTYSGVTRTDTLIKFNEDVLDLNGPCKIKVFTGVTLNNDGINDQFTIDNIEEFPKNKVQIFTRWGKMVFETSGYENGKNAWPQKGESGNYTSGTYFYVIDLGDSSPLIKGWFELINN